MINLKDKWLELSIEKRFLAAFILQNITLIGFAFCVEDDHFFGTLFIVSLICFCLFANEKLKLKKVYFTYSICFVLWWLSDHNNCLLIDFNVDYNQLKKFSGRVEDSYYGPGSISTYDFTLVTGLNKKNNKNFVCFPKYDACYKEKSKYYRKNISVKYAEFSVSFPVAGIIPAFIDRRVIYEIEHNGKIIYSYNYFINKYSQQQRNLRIFAIYLIVNSLVFCIFYQWIQKKYVQHS